jgi:hypothetical protein
MIGRPAGWYPDEYGVTRFWNGTAWTEHTAPPPPPASPQAPFAQQPYLGPHTMVTKSRKQTSHTFHLLMTIITFGAWGILVWLPITIYNAMRHDKQVTRIQ